MIWPSPGPGHASYGGGSPTPIMWLKLNDASGSTASDSSGNGNSGTITGTPTWTTGPNSNGALSFDGSTNFITVANASNFNFERTDKFSFTGWIKWNASATGSIYVLEKEGLTGNEPGYEIHVDADNFKLIASLIDSTGATIQTTTAVSSLTPTTWHFIAVTYDGSSSGAGLKIYIDTASAVTGTSTISNSIVNTIPVTIGKVSAFSSNFFWGIMDDARIYNVELASGDVSTIYTAGAQ